ncbi:MAG TPA: hypothetical protein QF601_02525 [Dehalococcoidia bacterium]|nr:hypothetical protein [Dehalococcoidia bacterium]
MINTITNILRTIWNIIFNILSITKTPLGILVVIILIILVTIMILRRRNKE